MTKSILRQYVDMQYEILAIRRSIERTEEHIDRIVAEGTVKDRVYGGDGGIQGFNIEGFPLEEYNKQVLKLYMLREKLVARDKALVDLTVKIERFVQGLPTSRERLIFRSIYLDGKTQEEVARQIHVDRSLISKIIAKYV